MLLYQRLIKTPLGVLQALSSLYGLVWLDFQEQDIFLKKHLEKNQGDMGVKSRNNPVEIEIKALQECGDNTPNRTLSILSQTENWISAYFENKKSKQIPPLDLWGSPFAQSTWRHLTDVQWGTTQSYSEVAFCLNKPRATRAIGSIIGQNPIMLIIPCHRIIGKDGSLRGFRSGLERKRWLLENEGVL